MWRWKMPKVTVYLTGEEYLLLRKLALKYGSINNTVKVAIRNLAKQEQLLRE